MTNPVKFSSGTIDLQTICDHYQIARDMGTLRSTAPTLYESSGNPIYISNSGPISLDTFRGKYSKLYSGNFSGSVSFNATDYEVGIAKSRVDATVSYSGSYKIGGESVIEVNITFSISTSVGYDNTVLKKVTAEYRNQVFSVNSRTCGLGNNILSFTNTQSLTIYAKANVYSTNSFGASNDGSLTDNYSASGTLGTGTLLTKQ